MKSSGIPETNIRASEESIKYLPPNTDKEVNDVISSSSYRLYGNLSHTEEAEHSNVRVTFNPDTGCSCSIVPLEVALACNLLISQLDPDEPVCLDIQGQPLDIRGQVRAVTHINSISEPLHFRAIVLANLRGEEVMLNLHTLIRWNILPLSWPFQMSCVNIAKKHLKNIT